MEKPPVTRLKDYEVEVIFRVKIAAPDELQAKWRAYKRVLANVRAKRNVQALVRLTPVHTATRPVAFEEARDDPS